MSVTSSCISCALHNLPVGLFATIIEKYLDVTDWSKLDIAFCSNRNEMRSLFVEALKAVHLNVHNVRNVIIWNERLDKGVLKWITARGILIVSWHHDDINDKRLIEIVSASNNISSLTVKHSPELSDAGVIATSLWLNSNLKEMTLCECENITNLSVIALTKGANNLESLSLAYCNKITDIGIASISSCLSKLRKLCIHELGNVTDSGFSHLANGCLQNLHDLDISNCAITEVGITSIANGNLHNLRVLNINDCNICSSQSLKALANGNLTQLRELYMGSSSSITDEGLEYLGSGNLNNLEVLYIGYGNYSGIGLAKIAKGMPSLLSLTVQQNESLTNTDMALTAIFTTLVNLKSLCISECDATDAGFEILNDAVSNGVKFAMSSLAIYGSKIGNTGVKAISSALIELKELELCYSEISDSGLHALDGSCFLELASLDLSGCKNITDDGVVALLNKLKCITSLNISNTKIGDRGIIAAFTELKCLTYLNISDTNITDDGLITAIKKSNGIPLKTLVMRRVEEVTDLGLGALVFGLPSLESLGISGVSWFSMRDHHRYTERNLEKIKQHFPKLLH